MTAAGGSLEDCHTNVFTLTELSGLKWKCLTTPPNFRLPTTSDSNSTNTPDIDQDPVLRSYGEALAQSLLCTWRRRPPVCEPSTVFKDPTPQIDAPKELWVFWYAQDEPKCIGSFMADGLIETDEYDIFEIGITYETRLLFFKSLHNAIERSLLRSGYIRFGKWFTRPLDLPSVLVEDCKKALPQYIIAINFHFFMHGENHVCMTVNIQRQPTMVKLSGRHLTSPRKQPVVLGPWSMRAFLLPDQPLLGSNGDQQASSQQTSSKPDNFPGIFNNAASEESNKHKKRSKKNGETGQLTLAEIQAAVNQQWNDWKRFHALPSDTDAGDESSAGSDNPSNSSEASASKNRKSSSAAPSNQPISAQLMPKMVLVEIDGVRMLYPTCFVGMLADEMVLETSQSTVKTDNTPTGMLNFSAEDHEVEEIFSSSSLSTPSRLHSSPTKRILSANYENTVIPQLRHCKRTFTGVRAAQRSFEDGCLSVLLSGNNPSTSSSTVSVPGNEQLELLHQTDTRWNFFDYLRREYCYCKMCSNINANPSTSTQIDVDVSREATHKDSYAFHRSPIALESVTPDQSPTFVDELNALKELQALKHLSGEKEKKDKSLEFTHDGEPLPLWAQNINHRVGNVGVKRVVSGRLELDKDTAIGTDIFKILQQTSLAGGKGAAAAQAAAIASANVCPARVMTPFIPYTSITPEPDDPLNKAKEDERDAILSQRLKEFSYTYNHLKRELPFSSEPYHLAHTDIERSFHQTKQIGPPVNGLNLPKINSTELLGQSTSTTLSSQQRASISGASNSSSTKAKPSGGTSILKSLLDSNMDESSSPQSLFGALSESSQANQQPSTSYNAQETVGMPGKSFLPPAKLLCHKQKRHQLHGMIRRKVKWPSVDKLDAMYSTVNELKEESTSFVMDSSVSNCAPTSLLSIPTTIEITSAEDELSTTSVNQTNRVNRIGGIVHRNRHNIHGLRIERLENPCNVTEDQQTSARSDNERTNTEEFVENSEQGEPMELSDAMTAVTPPALLSSSINNEEEDTGEREEERAHQSERLRSIMMDRQQKQPGSVSSAESCSAMDQQDTQQKLLPIQAVPITMQNTLSGVELCSATTSTTFTFANSHQPQQQHSVGSDHMHILSPPASNERIESGFFSAAVAATSTMAGLYSAAGGGQQQTALFNAMGTPMIMHDSLSIIYPTPPTPMQQFSPQNVIVNAQQLISIEGVLGAGCSSGPNFVQNLHDFCGSPPLVAEQFRQLQLATDTTTSNGCAVPKGITVEEVAVVKAFPQSESFSGNLLEEGADVEEKLSALTFNKNHLGNTALDQLDSLKKALLNRANRQKIEQVPSYKQLADNLRQMASREKKTETTDRQLAMALEKNELNLLSHISAHAPGIGFGHPGTYGMIQMQSQYANSFGGPHPYGHPINSMISGPANALIGNHGISSQFPVSGMHPGGMHPFPPNVFPGGLHGVGANPMMMGRMGGGGGGPHFRPGMLTPQQQQQYLQQQQMMAAGLNPMLKGSIGGMMQQSPGQAPFPTNNHPLAMQQMMNKSAGLMPPPNANSSQSFDPQSTSIFGKQQGNLGGRPVEQNFNQRHLQQQQMTNRFGSPPLASIASGVSKEGPAGGCNSNNHGSPASSAGSSIFNTPTGAGSSNSFLDGQVSVSLHHSSFHQQSPFGSPTSGALAVSKQQSLVARPLALSTSASSLLNNQMDYQLSSVSSTSSTGGPTVIATTSAGGSGIQMSSATALYSAINLDAIINSLQNGRSFVVAVLMQDTVIDLHYDSIFDACPICCCKSNIRAYELGVYINALEDVAKCDEIQRKQHSDPNFLPDYWSGFCVSSSSDPMQSQSKCSCGFSAVRHRYLCGAGVGSSSGLWGLFPEDLNEACGDRLHRHQQLNYSSKAAVNRRVWFDPTRTVDLQFMDTLRHQCLTRDVCSVMRSAYYLGDFTDATFENKNPRGTASSPPSNNYSVSRVDSVELNQIMCSLIGISVSSTGLQKELNRPSKSHQPVFHPWGVQLANCVREPKESEYIAVIRELQPLLEVTMFQARSGAQSPNKKFEGPLTWRSFLKKMTKTNVQQDDSEGNGQVEPIPNIVVATEREPVTTNPQLLNAWEKLALAPYDQTKDVLYLAVVPDSNVVVEKCRVFLEELSNMYEKCRFGSHVKMQTKDSPRDAIIRVGHQRMNGINPGPSAAVANNSSLQAFLNAFEDGKHVEDKKGLMSKLRGFIENYERELIQFFRANEHILFERRAYHESIQRNNQHQHYTSLATCSDSSSMPPPAIPIQSPSSILSSASGPASGNSTTHLSVGVMPVVVTLSPSGQPIAGQAQQQSPNPMGSASGMEELTPESHNGGTLNPPLQQQQLQQQQQQLDQANAIIEANIEKAVEEMLSLESPSYLPHVIVIYLVNPFSFGSEAHHTIFARLANVALMRAFNSFLYQLDIRRRPQIQLEMLSLQALYDYTAFAADPLREDRQSMESVENFTSRDKMSAQDCLRRTAFSVYSQSRLLLPESTRGVLPKSMTRFGPTSAMSDILDSLKNRPTSRLYKVPSSPFILAPNRVVSLSGPSTNPKIQIVNTEDRVLFVTYCLIADEWLVAAVTDEQGHLLDNVLINLWVPPVYSNGVSMKWKHKNQSQILDSIQRLWHYIQSVLVMDTKNWRLVIGRVGKIGHGEFKAWTEILSKRNLRSYNSNLKNSSNVNGAKGCRTCSVAPVSQVISACLVSTEPELYLRVFPGTSESSNGGGSTSTGPLSFSSTNSKSAKSKSPPQWQCLPGLDDSSITHIMVFPNILYISFEQALGPATGQEEDNDFVDFFTKKDHEVDDNEMMDFDLNDLGNDAFKNESDTVIDNQPMATGYYISTAPALDLPEWFWSACPSAKQRQPVHLKSSLHIHTGNIQQSEEFTVGNKGGAGGDHTHHPLDATSTDEALKYVLETYNALSWLNVDFATGARHSCLPVHIQALLRLYKGVTTLFS